MMEFLEGLYTSVLFVVIGIIIGLLLCFDRSRLVPSCPESRVLKALSSLYHLCKALAGGSLIGLFICKFYVLSLNAGIVIALIFGVSGFLVHLMRRDVLSGKHRKAKAVRCTRP